MKVPTFFLILKNKFLIKSYFGKIIFLLFILLLPMRVANIPGNSVNVYKSDVPNGVNVYKSDVPNGVNDQKLQISVKVYVNVQKMSLKV
jgi:hypothetical protein